MTFEEFQATRRAVGDVSVADRNCEELEPDSPRDAGFVYATGLFISRVGLHWPDTSRMRGSFHLLMSNEEWIDDDLVRLERELYDAFSFELAEENCQD